MCIYVYVCIYMYIYIYVYIHTFGRIHFNHFIYLTSDLYPPFHCYCISLFESIRVQRYLCIYLFLIGFIGNSGDNIEYIYMYVSFLNIQYSFGFKFVYSLL